VHPDDVAVGALELRVDVNEALHVVIAGRQVAKAGHGRPQVRYVDDGRLPWRQLLDLASEERRAGTADLQAGLAVVGARHHHVDPAGDRTAVDAGGKRDLNPHAAAGRRRLRHHAGHGGDHRHAESTHPSPHHYLLSVTNVGPIIGAGPATSSLLLA